MTKNKNSLELLKRHFDIALETTDGIKKLRELILTLAMQGKLVPQDPNDQPASELLKEIEAEKKKLIKEGKIKKQEPLPQIKPEEIQYELPATWEWVRFGEIAQHNSGKTLDGSRNEGEWREYITTSNLYWGFFTLENLRQMRIREDELERCTATKGDLLIVEGGEAGRAAVWEGEEGICIQNHIHRVRFHTKIESYYAYRFFEKINRTGEINNYRKGVAISNMSGKALASIIFPLPPRNEQKRIVAKINELMARCDKLEAERTERDKMQLAVNTVAINGLLTAPDKKAFNKSWQFIEKNFSRLYSVSQNVDELKKAILQLAVMGKLVPQDPNDQPASELLKEIETEKNKLIKEGKIKRQEPLPPIKPEEIQYELPATWEWVRFGEIAQHNSGKTLDGSRNEGELREYITTSNLYWGFFTLENLRQMRIREDELERCTATKGDLLIVEGGEAGRAAVWEGEEGICIQNHIHRVRFHTKIESYYAYRFFEKINCTGEINNYRKGVAISNLSGKTLASIIFPLPPHNEQKRIIAKIDELMALCDKLNKHINNSSEKKTEIFNSILAKI